MIVDCPRPQVVAAVGAFHVGLAASNPTEKLEVNGKIKLSTGSGGGIVFPDSTTQTTAASPPALPTRTVFTSGTATTYTTPAGARQLRIRMVGGGGGGATSGPNGFGGGGGGEYLEMIINAPLANYTYSVGAGGLNDSAGGNTSFDGVVAVGGLAGSSYNGGKGGSGGAGTASWRSAGGAGENGATSGTLSGSGGASALGGGSNAASTSVGYGGGGGGNGGTSGAGIIIIDEYY